MSTKHIEALKLALEGAANYIDAFGGDSRKYRQALAEQPAQRKPWVGLTEQEAAECWSTSTVRTWQAIEAKLREKNA